MLNILNNNFMDIGYNFWLNYCVFDIYKFLGILAVILTFISVLSLPTIFKANQGWRQTGRTLGAGAAAGPEGGVNALVNQGLNRWLGSSDGNSGNSGNKGNTGNNTGGDNSSKTGNPYNTGNTGNNDNTNKKGK